MLREGERGWDPSTPGLYTYNNLQHINGRNLSVLTPVMCNKGGQRRPWPQEKEIGIQGNLTSKDSPGTFKLILRQTNSPSSLLLTFFMVEMWNGVGTPGMLRCGTGWGHLECCGSLIEHKDSGQSRNGGAAPGELGWSQQALKYFILKDSI